MNSETSKVIALRFANEGWGNIDGWEKVWDEVVAADIIWHHCALPSPIQGDVANSVSSRSRYTAYRSHHQR